MHRQKQEIYVSLTPMHTAAAKAGVNIYQVWVSTWKGAFPLKVKMKPMFLTLSAHSMPYIQFRKRQSKHRGRNSLTCCPTSILGLIKTHIHRPSGRVSSGSGGILFTWCQGLNSVGSALRRQPPRRACSIYAALPPTPPSTPNPPPWFTGTLNSTVWTPLSNLFTLGALSTKKMSFSASVIVATTWAEVGLRKRELSRLGLFRRNTHRQPLGSLLLAPHPHAASSTPPSALL